MHAEVSQPGLTAKRYTSELEPEASMAHEISGVVTIVQESRFQLIDDAGVGHLFVLGPMAAAEPAQLVGLQHCQSRVRVSYREAANIIAKLATGVTLA